MSGPPRGCERFAQAAALRVDRELGPAEEAALAEHLETCVRCRRAARRSEALSAVLKRWDAERNEGIRAPARLRMAIRTTLADSARWRRAEVRGLRRARLATAASVLLVLGVSAVLGLGRGGGPDAARSPPSSPSARSPAPPPERAGFVDPGPLPTPEAAPSRLEAVAALAPLQVRALPEEEAARSQAALRALFLRRRLEAEFRERTGEPGVCVDTSGLGPEGGPTRGVVVSLDVLERAEDLLATIRARREEGERWRRERAERERRTPQSPLLVETGRRAADVLRLDAATWAAGRELDLGEALRVRLLEGSRERGPGFAPPRVLDLEEAVRRGVVVLRESGNDVVALVRDAPLPVIIPAGELIAGGRTDRVVRHGVWIPARAGEQPYLVRCHPVGTEGASRGPVPEPTGAMAGPRLRRLLVEGAEASEVASFVSRQTFALGYVGQEYSLLAAYDGSRAERRRVEQAWTALFRRAGIRGFLALDGDGAMRGVECTDLPRQDAAGLLARILFGYQMEAAWEAAHLLAAVAVEPRQAVAAEETLRALLASERDLRALPPDDDSGVHVGRLEDPDSGVSMEALVGGETTMLASGLAPLDGDRD